jgi:hypothetical protein
MQYLVCAGHAEASVFQKNVREVGIKRAVNQAKMECPTATYITVYADDDSMAIIENHRKVNGVWEKSNEN